MGLLAQVVSSAVRSWPYLRAYYQRIKACRGTKEARTVTARKLAELPGRCGQSVVDKKRAETSGKE